MNEELKKVIDNALFDTFGDLPITQELYRYLQRRFWDRIHAHLPVEAKSLPHTDPRVEWDDDNLINNDGEFA